jgi:hypothetical protein
MKQNDLTNLPRLSPYRYENFFNLYTEKNNELFYNLIKSVNIFQSNNSDIEETYTIKPRDTWILISFHYYNTIDLWWLVCTYNQINNPLSMPEAGTTIKLLNKSYVGYVLEELNRQLNL